MHGNEPSGRQLTLALAEHFCEHANDAAVSNMLERMHVIVAPTLNPDGFAAHTREDRCALMQPDAACGPAWARNRGHATVTVLM